MTPRLPDGFAVVLDPRTRRLDGGAALFGGSPLRLLRLRPAARSLLAQQPLRVRDARTARLARTLLDAGIAHPRPAASPPEAGVTVVIPVRDNPAGADRLLCALGAALPCIVVDDGSADPHALQRIAGRHGARLLRHPRSGGPAAARNAGLGCVRTPFVAFLDADVVPAAGWLAPLLAHLDDPAVALVAPRITALPGATGWVARYETVRSSLDLGPHEAPVRPRSRVAYVPSAALLVRVAAVAGGCFDERLRVAEDVDLCWRLHADGWRLRYEPVSTVAHEHRSDARKWLARKMFYGTGAAPLAARHPGQVPPVALAPWAAACALAVVGGGGAGLLAAAVVLGWRAQRLSRTLDGLRHPGGVATILLGRAMVVTVEQFGSAAWRSYWPVTALLMSVSPRARRAALLAGLLDGFTDWARRGRQPGGPGPLGHLAAKRLDDLAYGSGLWWGAARMRSLAALRPSMSG